MPSRKTRKTRKTPRREAPMPRGRGRPSRLSREMVVEAAVDWVRENHLRELSMRGLGALLGATPMALYRHVGTRSDLARQVVDRALGSVILPDDSLEPVAWLRELAHRLRAVFLEHPGMADLLLEEGPSVRSALEILDRTVRKLHGAGTSWEAATDLHNAFFSWLAGTVRRESAWRHGAGSADEALMAFRTLAASIPADELPGLAAALPRLRERSPDVEFETSLEFMLRAVEATLASRERSGEG